MEQSGVLEMNGALSAGNALAKWVQKVVLGITKKNPPCSDEITLLYERRNLCWQKQVYCPLW